VTKIDKATVERVVDEGLQEIFIDGIVEGEFVFLKVGVVVRDLVGVTVFPTVGILEGEDVFLEEGEAVVGDLDCDVVLPNVGILDCCSLPVGVLVVEGIGFSVEEVIVADEVLFEVVFVDGIKEDEVEEVKGVLVEGVGDIEERESGRGEGDIVVGGVGENVGEVE
jgi:hypothetical protein